MNKKILIDEFWIWHKQRTKIKNWLFCWLVSSIAIRFAYKIKHKDLFKNYNFIVKFKNRMKLVVSTDMWINLVAIINIFDNYMEGINIKLNKNDVVVDIGAHIGSFALPAFFNGAIVYAFEPDPKNYGILNLSIQANSIKTQQGFFLENVAVSKSSGFADFSIGATSTTGSLSRAGFYKAVACAPRIMCKTISLSEMFEKYNIKNCRLLKIDCEGSEYDIFYSTSPDVFRKIQNIVMDAHKVKNNNPKELEDYLKAQGFKLIGSRQYDNECRDLFFCNTLHC